MPTQIDHDESEWLEAFERGQLKSVATKSELARFKSAAREESIPYQTPIARVLHKYVSGRLTERPATSKRAAKAEVLKDGASDISDPVTGFKVRLTSVNSA